MAEHKHEWKVSYTMKTIDGVTTTYYCKPCGAFKTEDGEAKETRLSGMGGEFSTNWSAN